MKNNLLLLTLLLCGFFTNAQTWTNLTENPDQPGLEENPLKGFVDLFNPSNDFPRSVEASLFYLDDLMNGLDDYNWDLIDNFLATEAAQGDHCYIQVNIDPADGTTRMPAFLLGQVEFEDFPGDAENGPDLCPDWNDPELMEAMLNFINAFGIKYNGDNRVFLVHLGLYGMWGEWHIGEVQNIRPEFAMNDANKAEIVNAYNNAFPDKKLLARYPENMPDPQLYGYSDGLFFSESISESQWDHGYFHNTLKYYNADMNWKTQPIGGEIDPDLQPTIWKNAPNIVGQDVDECFDAIRPTWLFSHYIFTDLPENTTEWDNAIAAHKAMGYTFYLDKYRLTAESGNPAIEVNIQNTGIAPMYANWDVAFGVLNASDEFRSLGTTKWNLDLIQPDVMDNYRSFISTENLADGTYRFMLKVVNPLETISSDANPVRFANTTQDQDMDGWITLGEATISAGDLGTVPIQVSDISISPAIATVTVGDDLQFTPSLTPSNATNQDVTWVSDHPGTLNIDESGFAIAGPSYGTVLVSAYTQDGAFVGNSTITVEPQRVVIPALIQAEDYIRMSGVVVLETGGGNSKLAFIDIENWMEYGVTVTSPTNFTVEVSASNFSGGIGKISILNEANEVLDVIDITATDHWDDFEVFTSNNIPLTTGNHNLRLVATVGGFDLDWIDFIAGGPLPVELVSFKANPQQDNILLKWATSSEENNAGFNLERGTNNNDFTKIAWIDGRGTSNEMNQYYFVDADVKTNTQYYYRLAQQDLDGTITHSPIETAKINKDGIGSGDIISVYPNPTTNSLTIKWTDDSEHSPFGEVRVLNVFGAQVRPVILEDGLIDLTPLPAGIYFLEIGLDGEKVVKRVVKN